MSLIDEALKRAQEAEASRREGETPAARPWTPAPLPDAGLARRRRIVRIGGWSVVAALGVILLGVAVRTMWDAASPAARRPEPAANVPAPEPTFVETVVTTPLSSPPAAAAAVAPPRLARTAAPAPGGSEARPEPPAPLRPTALSSGPPPIADGRTYARSVSLDGGGRIELGGIVWSEEAPRALLNDRIVGVDAYVEGFTVSKIEEDRVALVRDGLTIYLTLK